MAIFSKFFGDLIILYNQRKCREKNKMNSDNFSIKNLEYTFVSFFIGQSLFGFGTPALPVADMRTDNLYANFFFMKIDLD